MAYFLKRNSPYSGSSSQYRRSMEGRSSHATLGLCSGCGILIGHIWIVGISSAFSQIIFDCIAF
ncbi:hypothetical protein X975_22502, partial [Stegodyphus mimosarum]